MHWFLEEVACPAGEASISELRRRRRMGKTTVMARACPSSGWSIIHPKVEQRVGTGP
jgi:hypothetical protein